MQIIINIIIIIIKIIIIIIIKFNIFYWIGCYIYNLNDCNNMNLTKTISSISYNRINTTDKGGLYEQKDTGI